MVDGDDQIVRQIQDKFPGWDISRVRDAEGRPGWWKAKRLRQLTRYEDHKGMAMALFRTTANQLREALAAEAELEAQTANDPASMAEVARTTISRDAGQVGKARAWLRDLLGTRPCVDDAVLCLSEVVTNSIRIETAAVGIAVFANHRAVRVEVTDDGSRDSAPRVCAHCDANAEAGRGLFLVNALTSEHWGTRADDGGRTTWFTVGLR
jgi:anti-sigma regulatory factor (Ser/Thr protein kinase)